MLALVSFPFLVEPQLATGSRLIRGAAAYVAFALLCAFTAWVSRSARVEVAERVAKEAESGERPGFWQLLFWVFLATCASVLLVSVTNHMSQNVAPIPLLWVLPLAIYLLTFIFAFESDRIYQRWLFIPLLAPALAGMAYMIYAEDGNFNIKYAIPGYAIGLFICCMFCHGELARRRPAPRHLTLFYLMVSLGGALGGIFVALIAPRVFHAYLELPLAMIACGVLALFAVWRLVRRLDWIIAVMVLVFVGGLGGVFVQNSQGAAAGEPLGVRDLDWRVFSLFRGMDFVAAGGGLRARDALWSSPRLVCCRRISSRRSGSFRRTWCCRRVIFMGRWRCATICLPRIMRSGRCCTGRLIMGRSCWIRCCAM